MRIKTVLLAPDEPSAQDLLRLASARLRPEDELCTEVMQDEAAVAAARARSVHGDAALGVLTQNEFDALEAISAGADEALVLPVLDQRWVDTLVARTHLRASLRRQSDQLRRSSGQAERLAAMGAVVAGVAHEINNPLAAMLLSVDATRMLVAPLFDAVAEIHHLVRRGTGATAEELAHVADVADSARVRAEAHTIWDEISTAGQTIATVVRDLRVFARVSDDDVATQVVCIPDLIDQVLRIAGRELMALACIERDYPPDVPPLVVPRTRLVQVLTNVLVNAKHAIREVQRPVHRIRISVRTDNEALAISISDTGPGIPAESLERVFDPFYTTKPEETGTGLGLWTSRSLLRALGGDLIVESIHGVGATFIALLPLPTPEALRAACRRSEIPQRPEMPSRRLSVLVAADERMLRACARVLQISHCVLLATDTQEAIELLDSDSEVDVVVVDLDLPEVDGEQLYTWLCDHQPDLARRMIWLTSGISISPSADFAKRVSICLLEKPVSRNTLMRAIERAAAVPSCERVPFGRRERTLRGGS